MNYIFIDSKDGINRIGLVEDNRLVEFYSEKQNKKRLVGNVYRARVSDVLKGMEAAFIDIGIGKNGYLHVTDALSKEERYSKIKPKISEVVKSGQEIIVQVEKEASGDKGPKLSKYIELPGRYLVLTPFSNKSNVSRKIRSRKEISRLKRIGKNIMKDNMGIIFRTATEGIDEAVLAEEYNILYNLYMKIEKERNFLPCPKLIYREPDLGYQIIRSNYSKRTEKIIVNTKEVYEDLLLMEEHYPFQFSDKLKLDLDFSMASNRKIQEDISEAFERKVNLQSGGYIVIDETEALTAIDINTGKFIGNRSLEETTLQTNLEASKEIARQIRLRDIGGIIIIDFIDMKKERDISLVLSSLKECFKNDKVKTNVIGMTKLGLVELTRKKIKRSLFVDLKQICPECGGRGNIINIKY